MNFAPLHPQTTIETFDTILNWIQVTVIVDDEDDNAPIFSASAYEGQILENSPSGTEVIMTNHVSARDPDEDASFVFTLRGEGSDLFRIDQIAGRIFFIGNSTDLLDREEKPLYNLRIIAGEGSKWKSSRSPHSVPRKLFFCSKTFLL